MELFYEVLGFLAIVLLAFGLVFLWLNWVFPNNN